MQRNYWNIRIIGLLNSIGFIVCLNIQLTHSRPFPIWGILRNRLERPVLMVYCKHSFLQSLLEWVHASQWIATSLYEYKTTNETMNRCVYYLKNSWDVVMSANIKTMTSCISFHHIPWWKLLDLFYNSLDLFALCYRRNIISRLKSRFSGYAGDGILTLSF